MYDKEYFRRLEKYESHQKGLLRWYKRIKPYNPKNILDVGCGNGYLVNYLNNLGFNAIGLDNSEYAGTISNQYIHHDATKGLPFEDKEFDLVISSDFFEHLPEDKIDSVRNEMLRVGKNVIALINFKKEKIDNTHLTVKPREWWRNKLIGVVII